MCSCANRICSRGRIQNSFKILKFHNIYPPSKKSKIVLEIPPPPPPPWRCGPTRARASWFFRFLDHTQRRTTVGRTPLDEWSARRRDLYLTTHNRAAIGTGTKARTSSIKIALRLPNTLLSINWTELRIAWLGYDLSLRVNKRSPPSLPLMHTVAAEVLLHSFIISTLGRDEWWTSSVGRPAPWVRNLLLIEQVARWAPGTVWSFRCGKKIHTPAGNRTPNRPAHSLITISTMVCGQGTVCGNRKKTTFFSHHFLCNSSTSGRQGWSYRCRLH